MVVFMVGGEGSWFGLRRSWQRIYSPFPEKSLRYRVFQKGISSHLFHWRKLSDQISPPPAFSHSNLYLHLLPFL